MLKREGMSVDCNLQMSLNSPKPCSIVRVPRCQLHLYIELHNAVCFVEAQGL